MDPCPLIDAQQLAAAPERDLALLREALATAGFSRERLAERLAFTELPVQRLRVLPAYRAAAPTDTLDTLVRLFLTGVPVPRAAAAEALRPLALENLEALQVIQPREGGVAALIRFVPVADLLLAHDPPEIAHHAGAPRDTIPGLTNSTTTVLECTVRSRIEEFLDLGTGMGVQALAAARHSTRVTGTDFCARALDFARFNARLNGITNVEFVGGDRFEPVRGRRFGRIVSNPPFLISPGGRYLYRDGGLEADGFCRSIVRQAPELLEEGGLAQYCAEWIHPKGGDWRERLLEWFDGIGCDVLVLRLDTRSPSRYADEWIRETEGDDPAVWAPLYDRYLAYYEELGVEAVSSGVINLRKRSGARNRVRFDDVVSQRLAPVGAWIELAFELGDALEALDGPALLEQRLRLSPSARLEHVAVCQEGSWRPVRAQIHLVDGLEFRERVDMGLIGLLARANGKTPLRELLAGLAAAARKDFEPVAEQVLPQVRRLIEQGFLLPEGVRLPEKPA